MILSRRHYILAVSLLLASTSAHAQVPFSQSPFIQQSATPDADALANEMRLLAANPSDVNAMVRAGELTLKLDDPTAAAGFFARAERIDPSNPRIKAGKGILLVQGGRPGEALRLFAEAEALRGDVRSFAADRGLAYDLIGEQERAQRDYRLALKNGPADETLRRYALSLGISGQRDEALATIDQLLRRSDRGAWRARAFILAMNGDAGGAERIAASMMPGGLGQGLQPFFDRLPKLGAADRAFAVHFGEVRMTPQRMVDARMTPRLPALTVEPGRPVAVAAAVVPSVQPVQDDRRSKRDRKKRGKDRVVLSTIAPPVPLPQPPAYQGTAMASVAGSGSPQYVQSLPQASVPVPVPVPVRPPVTLASNDIGLAAATRRIEALPTVRATTPTVQASGRLPMVAAVPADRVAALNETPVRSLPPATTVTQVVTAQPIVVAPQPVVVPVPTIVAPPVREIAPPVVVAATPVPTEIAAVSPTVLPPVPGPVKGEDSILARIIANITVPGSELDVAAAPVPEVAPAPIAIDDAQATLIAEQKAADRVANDKAVAERKRVADRKLAEASKPVEAAVADETPIVRKRGETLRQFEARKSAAADVADAPAILRKRGETVRQFEARKLAASAAVEAPDLVRKRGETVRQFEARKLAASKPPVEDDAPALRQKRGETARQFEARKLAASQAAVEDNVPALRQRRGESTRQFEARKLAARDEAADDAPTLKRKSGETARQFEAHKLAATKKAGPDKSEAKSSEPSRIWVQVSGGANESDLRKEWARVKDKAPVAFKGMTGWTTPLRATNRVLAGPFKTDAEARSFVNALGKEGISAFAFTSEAGQKVSRLAVK